MVKLTYFVYFVLNIVLIKCVEYENQINIVLRENKTCAVNPKNYKFVENSNVTVITEKLLDKFINHATYKIRKNELVFESKSDTYNSIYQVIVTKMMDGEWTFTYMFLEDIMPPERPFITYKGHNYTTAVCSAEITITPGRIPLTEWLKSSWSIGSILIIAIAFIVICLETTAIVYYFKKVGIRTPYGHLSKNEGDKTQKTGRERYSAAPMKKMDPELIPESRDSTYECPEFLGIMPNNMYHPDLPPNIPSTPRPKTSQSHLSTSPLMLHRPNKDIELSIKNRPKLPVPTPEEIYEEADFSEDDPGIYEEFEESPPVPSTSKYVPPPLPTKKPYLPPPQVTTPLDRANQPLSANQPLGKPKPPAVKPAINEKPRKPTPPIGKLAQMVSHNELKNKVTNRNNPAPSQSMLKKTPSVRPNPTPNPKKSPLLPAKPIRSTPPSPVPQPKDQTRQPVKPTPHPPMNKPTVNKPSTVNTPIMNKPIVNTPIMNKPIVNTPIMNKPIVNKLPANRLAEFSTPVNQSQAPYVPPVHHPQPALHRQDHHQRFNQPTPTNHQHYPTQEQDRAQQIEEEPIYNPWDEEWDDIEDPIYANKQ